MKILIAAGGTGGHINPGIAIANRLKEKGNDVIFVGTEKGLEKDLVPKAGYEIKYIHAEGIHRGFSLQNIRTIINLQKGICECEKLIKELKIDFAIGTGGYVTAPLMIAGIKKKIPTLIHESNALPGKTTNWLSKKVDCVAVGFEAAKEKLPNGKNIVFTGNPTNVLPVENKREMKEKLGVKRKLVLVFGGSQGAKKINDTMIELINEKKDLGYRILFATGPKNYEEVMEKIKVKNDSVTIEKYIYNMQEVMAASDLVVARSGALTVTEIEIMGLPSILIPFPYAAENHQYYNAKALEDRNAGKIIEEKNLTKERLEQEIATILLDDEKLQTMSQNAKSMGDCKALERIECEIEKIMSEK